jgi:pSer/pThr/pTyr-binding forkhead associated (FHA) protein
VVDLGSTNGTLVNDSPVSERALEEGDRITIGRTVLEFRRA